MNVLRISRSWTQEVAELFQPPVRVRAAPKRAPMGRRAALSLQEEEKVVILVLETHVFEEKPLGELIVNTPSALC